LSYGHEYYKQLTRQPSSGLRSADAGVGFGEYWTYQLPEKTTVASEQISQVELFTAEDVPVERTYLYDGAKVRWLHASANWSPDFGRDENKVVQVLVEFENRAADNLGFALPGGKCRIYKSGSEKSPEFIGEDVLDHTPRGGKIALYVGDAHDVVGRRGQTDFKSITDRVFEEAFEITVRNHKEEAVTVKVLEKLYRHANWKILENSHGFQKLDGRTIVFPVTVDRDGEVTVRYRVRYES
jgi:hypothetical protein